MKHYLTLRHVNAAGYSMLSMIMITSDRYPVLRAFPQVTIIRCGVTRSVSSPESISASDNYTMWRYRPFLPVEEDTVQPPLRVGWSPLYEEPRMAKKLGIRKLFLKDDGLNPTASLKDRASSMGVAKAIEAGYDTIACSSTGNAASSLAGNSAAAGLKTYIFVPERAPIGKVAQLLIFGAKVISVKGNYEDTFELSKAAIDEYGWYNRNAAINCYLMEGKKTVALEIAEQLGWKVPDYVALSVGDGCTIAGVWKGFKDLYNAGFIDTGEPWEPMEENTLADSISVGVPRNADKAIAAIIESNGIPVEVTDDEILEAMRVTGRECGVFGEPAGVTGMAGLTKLCSEGKIPADASVAVIVTGNGLKDTANGIKAAGEPIRLEPDMDKLRKVLNI